MPVLTAILSFLSTNTDDLVVLMLLYAQAKGPRDWRGSRPFPKKSTSGSASWCRWP